MRFISVLQVCAPNSPQKREQPALDRYWLTVFLTDACDDCPCTLVERLSVKTAFALMAAVTRAAMAQWPVGRPVLVQASLLRTGRFCF
ncbi:hypothetical protein N7340_05905 [Comamonas aquatica]|uniref:hypothetical protein n=1 Tax=Comamonas aquatica TaxID=225991 RepID=UPI00244A4A17|nr:hypothetical protein [Comamonas aquatica]MDH0371313.1 hypothetical protein [Comamonas aquatica]